MKISGKCTPIKPNVVRRLKSPHDAPSDFHTPVSRRPSAFPLELNRKVLSANSSRGCNCKKSNCLKLYCDCFSLGEYCSNCNCSGCYNNEQNENIRKDAIRSILERNPSAFRPKISTDISVPISLGHNILGEKHNKVIVNFIIGMCM